MLSKMLFNGGLFSVNLLSMWSQTACANVEGWGPQSPGVCVCVCTHYLSSLELNLQTRSLLTIQL